MGARFYRGPRSKKAKLEFKRGVVCGLPLPKDLLDIIEQGRWKEPWGEVEVFRLDDDSAPRSGAVFADWNMRVLIPGLYDELGVERYGADPFSFVNRLFPGLCPVPEIRFFSLREMYEQTHWHRELGWCGEPLDDDLPGDLDPDLTVMLGDHGGPGNDAAFALDFRASMDEPAVVASHWARARRLWEEQAAGRITDLPYDGPHWRTVAPNIKTFIEALHL